MAIRKKLGPRKYSTIVVLPDTSASTTCTVSLLMMCNFSLGQVQECPDSTELIHNGSICPGQVGVLQCTVINAEQFEWTVNGEIILFLSRDNVGDSRPGADSNTVAYLVARTPADGSGIFNWTSLVNYRPDASIRGSVPITCSGGITPCRDTTLVLGMSLPQSI